MDHYTMRSEVAFSFRGSPSPVDSCYGYPECFSLVLLPSETAYFYRVQFPCLLLSETFLQAKIHEKCETHTQHIICPSADSYPLSVCFWFPSSAFRLFVSIFFLQFIVVICGSVCLIGTTQLSSEWISNQISMFQRVVYRSFVNGLEMRRGLERAIRILWQNLQEKGGEGLQQQ